MQAATISNRGKFGTNIPNLSPFLRNLEITDSMAESAPAVNHMLLEERFS